MGQKTNPIGNRLGIIRGWDSNWFGGKDFGAKVVEDEQIRTYLKARIEKGGIARSIIERTLKRITVTIHTSRPGIIIGRGGQEVDRIREELRKLTKKDVQRYVETFDAFSENLARECASHRVDFLQISSNEAFEERFLDLLVRGSALAGGA